MAILPRGFGGFSKSVFLDLLFDPIFPMKLLRFLGARLLHSNCQWFFSCELPEVFKNRETESAAALTKIPPPLFSHS